MNSLLMNKYVVGIGAANVDIYAKSKISIKEHFDHPSIITTAVGGVTRNILENVSRLGIKSFLLSAVGDDIYGKLIINESSKAGIDCSHVLKVKNTGTGIFLQVKDNKNDMHMALCDMSVISHINKKYIDDNSKLISNASALVLDPSLDNKIIEYIFEKFPDVKVFVDPISDFYAKKIKKYLKHIYCIKPNRNELSVLANMDINDDNDLISAYIKVNKKADYVFASLNNKGCLYTNDNGEVVTKKLKEVKNMINASGAGDCFFGVLIYGYVNGLNIDETIDLALAGGIATVTCENTINHKLSIKMLRKIVKENENGLQ